MAVLQFDGVDDELGWTTLAAALGNVSDGAWTVAVLVKRAAIGSIHAITTLLSASGTSRETDLRFDTTDHVAIDPTGLPDPASTATFTSTTSPYMLVVSKGAGTVTPRLAWKLGSGGAWSHEDMSITLADQIASTSLLIGGVDSFDGWIGVVAWWEGAMSDVNKEALDNTWRTSNLWSSAHGQPVFLAECNKAGASVVDLAGNATSIAVVGTTLAAAETLDGWTFDGIGRVAKVGRKLPAGTQFGLAPGLTQ